MHNFIVPVILFSFYFRSEVDSKIIANDSSCSGIVVGVHGISQSLLLKTPAQGNISKVCQNNLTCCSKQLEDELHKRSSSLLSDALHQRMNFTQLFLAYQASKFDDFFRNLLAGAKINWHDMLWKTYKNIYLKNRHIFDRFFLSLEDYYMYGNVSLVNSTKEFFQEVQDKMLVLLQPSLAKQQDFLKCVSKYIDVIKPFGKGAKKITSQLKSSLFIVRTFIQSLKVARNMSTSLINHLVAIDCQPFTLLRYCSICQGISEAKMCKASCELHLASCFSSVASVDKEWDDLLRTFSELATIMDGPYNIEAVAGQLSYDISMAVMELQDNFDVVLTKSQLFCKIRSGKTKREADPNGNDLYLEGDKTGRLKRDSYSLPDWQKRKSSNKKPRTLDSLTDDFRKQLIQIKSVWSTLPKHLCGDQSFVAQNPSESCWNGKGLQRNSQSVPFKSTNNQKDSREKIQAHILLLRNTIDNNKKALSSGAGHFLTSVDGDDDDDNSGSGSASGLSSSGSGSGDDTNIPATVRVLTSGSKTTVLSSPLFSQSPTSTPKVYPTPTDDDEDTESSGSGSGNEIPEFRTTPSTEENTVDDHPNYSDDEEQPFHTASTEPIHLPGGSGTACSFCNAMITLLFLHLLLQVYVLS